MTSYLLADMTVWKIDPKFESDLVNNAAMCTLDLNDVFTENNTTPWYQIKVIFQCMNKVYVADQSLFP